MNHSKELTYELHTLRSKILQVLREKVKNLPTEKTVIGFHIFKFDIPTLDDVIVGINPDLSFLTNNGDEVNWLHLFNENILLNILREVEDLQPSVVMNNKPNIIVDNFDYFNLELSKISYTFIPSKK
jgi:hypothetical protein